MIKLSIPVPPAPILEDALGYAGDARLLSIYWTPSGDEAVLDDGLKSGDGYPWGYLAYLDDPRVALGIATTGITRWALGSSDEPHTHRLVIDLEARTAYLATEAEAVATLAAQWPPSAPMTAAELEEVRRSILAALATYQAPSPAAVQAAMAANYAAVERLRQWLDGQPMPDLGDLNMPTLSDASTLVLLNPWTHAPAQTMSWGEIKAWCETHIYPADRPLWLAEARKAALAGDGETLGAMIIGA